MLLRMKNRMMTHGLVEESIRNQAREDVFTPEHTIVRVIFDTEDQLQNDHLPSQGTVSASEVNDDDIVYYDEWTC
jgi:hypothetical protein